MMQFSNQQRRSKQAGIVAVEMALVLPVLLILLFVIGEFGYLFQQYTTLNVLQRSAARYLSKQLDPGVNGIVNLTSDSALEDIAIAKQLIIKGTTDLASETDTALLAGLSEDDISIVNASTSSGNDVIVITTLFKFNPLFGMESLPNFLNGNEFSLTFQLPASMAIRVINSGGGA